MNFRTWSGVPLSPPPLRCIPCFHQDVLIVGSGAAALTAALRVKSHNLTPLIIEKTSHVGGTTSYSGGGLWIPNSGIHPSSTTDTFAEALKYMKNTIDAKPTKSSSLARKTAFLDNGPKMVKFLADQGFKWQPSLGYPDYYPLVEGGKVTGRSIEGKVFNLKKLGDWQDKIRMTTRRPIVPVYTHEAGDMYRMRSGSLKSFLTAAKVIGLRMGLKKLTGQFPVTLGMSLVGQLLHLCLKKNIPILLDSGLKELLVKDGVVIGAVVIRNGQEVVIESSRGVILAAGGFARNTAMRKQHQKIEGAEAKTLTGPEDKGDAISAAIQVGATTELMDEAWWGPTLVDNAGNPTWVQFERALPHSIVVDQKGNRFVNESESYTRFIHNLFKHQTKTDVAIPAFLILDSNHREKYLLAGMMPGKLSQRAQDSGLIVKADTLEELAGKLGIDPEGFQATIDRFNTMARAGTDEDFQRGQSPYDQFFGDPNCKPNPNLGTISKSPFYGAKLVPGDLGTKGGVLTDEHARGLREDGTSVKGLYAIGNSSAAVMGKEYIGAGSTLGPGLTFAFVAADHIATE
ncbi:3-ketosteroid dehydrogenase [Melanomma pulvis-pyrius CBS 109.77]|uniref:3-ketosteroid dehydrogenase n=1 Tax=Melanomma pulvis-pyrius CBS 109.77 TaxID=1314802 RepID=A0A6A6X909_9PLEO|nr:3-ketosteroid dehydrogenase [Melanomma pulvis-pyrius CBS 109.77]